MVSQGLRMTTSYFQGCVHHREMSHYDGNVGLPGAHVVSH